jgi:hypothetical protein
MKKKTRVIIIDTVTQSVKEALWDGNSKQLRAWVGAETLDSASGPTNAKGHRGVAFVDDMGMATNKPRWFWPEFYPRPLIGNAMIFGANRKGETVDAPYSLDEMSGKIFFQDVLSELDTKRMPRA